MRWSSATREGIVAAVRDGGPFYVYGSDAGPARSALERAYPKPRPVM
jgi:hypothetical protein